MSAACRGEIAPVEIDRAAGDLPMSRRRILAARCLDRVAPEPGGGSPLSHQIRISSRRWRRAWHGRGQDAPDSAGAADLRANPQRSPGAAGAALRDMAQRVRAFVAIGRRIPARHRSHRVEDDQEGAFVRNGHGPINRKRCRHPPLRDQRLRRTMRGYRGFQARRRHGPRRLVRTTRPFCITMTWLASARTTLRSWLMNM